MESTTLQFIRAKEALLFPRPEMAHEGQHQPKAFLACRYAD